MTNNISSVRIKNFSKEEIKYKFVQKNNFNIIKTNIKNNSIRNLKKYEDFLGRTFLYLHRLDNKILDIFLLKQLNHHKIQ